MRLLVLTTETTHHAYFVRQITPRSGELRVLLESTGVVPPFDVAHPFEAERDRYEAAAWFDGKQQHVADLADSFTAQNVNDSAAIDLARAYRPDLTVVFGTRRLRAPVIEACGPLVVNLHGGDPEYYRGLDTHLWAIYHSDFTRLSTTLHVLNEQVDDGPIIGMKPLALEPGMRLHELRRRNTEAAVDLTADAIDSIRSGQLSSRPQRQAGRYYSFMPSVLKQICVERFAKYCSKLR
jgi:methionyl-tRNA formyltransferase